MRTSLKQLNAVLQRLLSCQRGSANAVTVVAESG